MERGDARVVIAGNEKHGWVLHARLHMVIGRISVEILELGRDFRGAVLRYPERPFEKLLIAEHVFERIRADNGLEKLGALGECGSHEKAAVAASTDGEPRRGGVFLRDQPLGGRD